MSQMEENAHCPLPEKLSSLAFCLSMNSLYARRGPGQSSRVQRGRAVPSRAVPGPSVSGSEPGDGRRPGECGDGEEEYRGCDKQKIHREQRLSGEMQCLLVYQSLHHFY